MCQEEEMAANKEGSGTRFKQSSMLAPQTLLTRTRPKPPACSAASISFTMG
jgi:hypothetical protein